MIFRGGGSLTREFGGRFAERFRSDLIIRVGGKLLCQLRGTFILIVLTELDDISGRRELDTRIWREIRRKIQIGFNYTRWRETTMPTAGNFYLDCFDRVR